VASAGSTPPPGPRRQEASLLVVCECRLRTAGTRHRVTARPQRRSGERSGFGDTGCRGWGADVCRRRRGGGCRGCGADIRRWDEAKLRPIEDQAAEYPRHPPPRRRQPPPR